MPYKDYEKQKRHARDYYYSHREKTLTNVKKYYQKNWEKKQEQRKAWLQANPEKFKQFKKRYSLTKKGKLAFKRAFKKWWDNPLNKKKQVARRMVRVAVKKKILIKPDKCKKCFKQLPLEAHHFKGYEEINQLKVRWLCHKCHLIEEKLV